VHSLLLQRLVSVKRQSWRCGALKLKAPLALSFGQVGQRWNRIGGRSPGLCILNVSLWFIIFDSPPHGTPLTRLV